MFITQRKIVEIDDVGDEAEKQTRVRAALASSQKLLKIIKALKFGEITDNIVYKECKFTESINLERNDILDKYLREKMTATIQSPKYQYMNFKRKELPTYAVKQVGRIFFIFPYILSVFTFF